MVNQATLKQIVKMAAVVAVVAFVIYYFSAFLPILLAILTAMLFEPLVRWLKRKLKVEKRILPVTIVFSTFLVICSYTLYITLTRVAKSIFDWSLNLPRYAREIQQFVDEMIINFNEFIEEVPQGHLIVSEIEKRSESLTDTALQLATELINTLGIWIQSIPNTIFVTVFYFITLFLISLDFPRLANAFYNFFKVETSNKLRYVFQRMGKVFFGYWKAQFILSVGVFVITYASLLFISPNAALTMSIIIWVVDIIPLYVGPALVLVPWGLLAMILGNMSTGVQLILLATILLILRRAIEPKVLGDSIGLAALPTVLTMYFGYVLFGVIGLILGPFVYIAFRSAMEGGLFDFKFFKKEEEEQESAKLE